MVSPEDIARIPLFEDLPPAQLVHLASIASAPGFARGQVIFAEGDRALGLHVVDRGRVKVSKIAPDGKEQILHIWGPGEPFGEVALFAGGSYPAHAEALEDSRTIFIPRAGLLELIDRQPELALDLLAVLSLRLKRFAAMVEAFALKEVPSRLAAYLLLLDDERPAGAAIGLDVSKGQLANLLGTAPETLSRILARMAREGPIEEPRPRAIRILDRAALEQLADGRRRLA